MTRQRSFKRLVRARMEKTGESYTAARAALLTGMKAGDDAATAPLATSDEKIRDRTGRGWEEWFDLLDESGARDKPHREIARWVADLLGVVPLAWAAQAVTASYERARRGRQVGEHPDGFTVHASRTIGAPAEGVFDLLADDERRTTWLDGATLTVRTATRPRSLRLDHDDDGSRVSVVIDVKDDGVTGARCTVAVAHARLADAAVAAERKGWWRERLVVLRSLLEEGGTDA